MNKKLGILLSTSPDNKNLGIVTGLIQTAIKSSVSVYLYLIDDVVKPRQLGGLFFRIAFDRFRYLNVFAAYRE